MEKKRSFFVHLSILLGLMGAISIELLSTYEAYQERHQSTGGDVQLHFAGHSLRSEAREEKSTGEAVRLRGGDREEGPGAASRPPFRP